MPGTPTAVIKLLQDHASSQMHALALIVSSIIASALLYGTLFLKELRVRNRPRSRSRFFFLHTLPEDNIILLACIVYSVRYNVHKLRSKNVRAEVEHIGKHLWEAVKLAAAHHTQTNSILKSVWRDP